MTDRTIVRIGGFALVGGALAFMAVFTWFDSATSGTSLTRAVIEE